MSSTAAQDENTRIRELLALDRSTLPPDGGPRFNRLIFSASPYLLQHAENPVDWYPWGEEAFRTAAAEDKPVFLSIGYATCHWCHVMAHESFADPAVATVLNRTCVAIKVDREERPDLDDQFMAVSQLMTGSGGWPLNLFLTPAREPFFAATYIPKLPRGGMIGFIELLEQMARLWRERRDAVERNVAAILEGLGRLAAPAPGPPPEADSFAQAGQHLTRLYDEEWGGFGSAPKFPMPHYLSFLLRSWSRSQDPAPLRMAAATLERMRAGGICDQLGFGFHRYSVDRQWLVPHFEKMLYDQAQIALAGLEAYQATGEEAHRTLTEEVFTYLLRDLRHPDGPFYAAEDADSEGEEGLFYLWTPAEVREVLGKEDGELFCRLFDVTPTGNFEGRSILHLPLPMAEFAAREGVAPASLATDLGRWREALRAARERRIRPLRDEKLLTAWNGLAVAALARGFAVTAEERYGTAAAAAADWLLVQVRTPTGRLLRSRLGTACGVPAFLEDYACLIWGLIELHQATLEERWLATALELTAEALRLFDAGDGGGLQDVGSDGEELLVRQRTGHDGVVPAGNGLMAVNLVRLGRLAADPELLRAGERLIAAFGGSIGRQPAGYLNLLLAGDLLASPELTLTLVGRQDDRGVGELLRTARRRYLPGLAVRFVAAGQAPAGQRAVAGRATAYLCAEGACRPPVTGIAELERLLGTVRS